MKSLKKAVFILSLLMVTTAASCSVKEETKITEENITFDWYINFSWYKGSWGGDLVAQKITADTGVELNYISPSGNESEKLSALMNSDSLPDIITLGWWEPQVNEMIDAGMVYAWNELAKEYDTRFMTVADPDVVQWYTKEDGNIYCYPNSYYTPKDLERYQNISSNETFVVRKDIYEAIGSPDMSTPEGFMNAVREATRLFPEVDGRALIPIGSHVFDNMGCVSFDKYLQNFLAIPYEKNGQIYDRYTDPEYIEWLKVFRQLGEEGYLAPDIFVDTRTQMDEKLFQGRYFCMFYQYTDLMDQQKILAGSNSESIYIAIDGPSNRHNDQPQLPVTGINGWTVTLISKNCQDPKRAMEFIEYLMSEEGQMVTYLGVEGETYDLAAGEPVVKPEVLDLLNSSREQYDEKYGADYKYWMFQNLTMEAKYPQKYPEYVSQLKEWSYPYVIYNGQYDTLLPAESAELTIDNRATLLWSQTLPALLLAESEAEFDQILQTFIAEREALGYDKVLVKRTEMMIQAKQALGIE